MATERFGVESLLPMPPAKEPSKDEMWQNSPQKADINTLEQMVSRGEITRDQAVAIYRQKWRPQDPPGLPQTPNNPAFRQRW